MNQDVGGCASDWGYHIYNIGAMCPQLLEKSMEEDRSYQKVLWYKIEERGIIWTENIL
jgi:hypothetical protein